MSPRRAHPAAVLRCYGLLSVASHSSAPPSCRRSPGALPGPLEKPFSPAGLSPEPPRTLAYTPAWHDRSLATVTATARYP
jgi:hypothetical protein